MKCKDIDEKPILEFLRRLNGKTATWFGDEYENSVTNAMPKGIYWKLAVSKMRQMIKKGTVSGCACGCRGDYLITEKGIRQLNDN